MVLRRLRAAAVIGVLQARKWFFFEKKHQKASSIGVPAVGHPMDEKFFASFCSQKEDA
jgi:hypothetical protein